MEVDWIIYVHECYYVNSVVLVDAGATLQSQSEINQNKMRGCCFGTNAKCAVQSIKMHFSRRKWKSFCCHGCCCHQTLLTPAGMCGFQGKAVMSRDINDTARFAPTTARITAVYWLCIYFFKRKSRKNTDQTKSQSEHYWKAGRGCAVMTSHNTRCVQRSGQVRSSNRLKKTKVHPQVDILLFMDKALHCAHSGGKP